MICDVSLDDAQTISKEIQNDERIREKKSALDSFFLFSIRMAERKRLTIFVLLFCVCML